MSDDLEVFMLKHLGGCLCGTVRYETMGKPQRVTFCHCKYCQRSTGSAYAVETFFAKENFRIISGNPTTYSQASADSGRYVTAAFCSTCGTKLYLDLERLPDNIAIYGGTFDDPDWFDRTPEVARHIFLKSAQKGTAIPAGYTVFHEFVVDADGVDVEPVVLENSIVIGEHE
jgi:hypothetical protein